MSFLSNLFGGGGNSSELNATNASIADIQKQLSDLSSQATSLDPNAAYQTSAGEDQYLADVGNRVSARYAGLGFGDSPLTGGAIASQIAPALSNFRNQAFQNKLNAFATKSNTLGNYYTQLLERQKQLQSQKKKPWWQSLLTPVLTGVGTAFGGPIGGALGGAAANLFTTKTGGSSDASYTFK